MTYKKTSDILTEAELTNLARQEDHDREQRIKNAMNQARVFAIYLMIFLVILALLYLISWHIWAQKYEELVQYALYVISFSAGMVFKQLFDQIY